MVGVQRLLAIYRLEPLIYRSQITPLKGDEPMTAYDFFAFLVLLIAFSFTFFFEGAKVFGNGDTGGFPKRIAPRSVL